jgi:uncharacterized protein YbjT (DUF2867 family)
MGEVQGYNYFMRTALIAGGTGLIGAHLLQLLLTSNRYEKVIALTRKNLSSHPKLIQQHIDGESITLRATIGIDDIFCCLGTTMAKAGSKEKFYQVDFTYPFNLGTQGLNVGAKQFLIVTTVGARKNSPIYYNRIKGEIEAAVSGLGFRALHIFRPSLLLGERQERRTGEEAARIFFRLFGPLIPKKYQAIDSAKVARAMLHFASLEQNGNFIHDSGQLQGF